MKTLILSALTAFLLTGCVQSSQVEQHDLTKNRQKNQLEVNTDLLKIINKMNFEEDFLGIKFTNNEEEINNIVNETNYSYRACSDNKLRDVNLNLFNIKVLKDQEFEKYVVILTDKENENYKRIFHESKTICELTGRSRDFVLEKMKIQNEINYKETKNEEKFKYNNIKWRNPK